MAQHVVHGHELRRGRTAAQVFEHAVLESAEANGIGPGPRGDIALAVSEACTNVVVHAYEDVQGLPKGGRGYKEASAQIQREIRRLWDWLVVMHEQGRPKGVPPTAGG